MNAMTQVARVQKTKAAETVDDPRWAAVVARDPATDDRFYYSVATTGVYCRPSCAARLPRPENVRFHASRAAAEKAGFRPCKRCKPDQPSLAAQRANAVARACTLIADAESPPQLEDLAAQVGMSPYHFHRIFKSATGLTPRAFAAAQREHKVRTSLAGGGSVTAAIFDAGYNASSRFYEKSHAVLGMTPTAYKAGAPQTAIHYAVGNSSLGTVLAAESDKGICAIFIGDTADELVEELQRRFAKARLVPADKVFEKRLAKVLRFVDAPGLGLDLPLDMRGTAFQKRVWLALQKIPVGKTSTYTEVAKRIGAPKSVRAVAAACAANPLAVIVPCHRVVRRDGALAGYRWGGIARKRALLDVETASARPASKPSRKR